MNNVSEQVKVYMTGVILIFMMTIFAFIFSLQTIHNHNIDKLEKVNNVLILCEKIIEKDFKNNY